MRSSISLTPTRVLWNNSWIAVELDSAMAAYTDVNKSKVKYTLRYRYSFDIPVSPPEAVGIPVKQKRCQGSI